MAQSSSSGGDITNLAMEAVRSHPGDVVTLAPPGAGKTELLIDLITLTAIILGRTVLAAAVSNDQCDDITRRAATIYPRLRIDRFVATNETRSGLAGLPNVHVVDATSDLAAPVVVATVAKFGEIKDLGYVADQLFIDEAYQARRADYDRIRALATKACLIGDPGQIRPIYKSDIRLYAADPCGPHVAFASAASRYDRCRAAKLLPLVALLRGGGVGGTADYRRAARHDVARPRSRPRPRKGLAQHGGVTAAKRAAV
jgi:hypothetical protein